MNTYMFKENTLCLYEIHDSLMSFYKKCESRNLERVEDFKKYRLLNKFIWLLEQVCK